MTTVFIGTIIVHLVVRQYFYQIFADIRFALTNSVYLTTTESCCTAAVLFRGGTMAQQMADELSREKAMDGHAKDHILDESEFEGRLTDANLVVHIGYYSYLRRKVVKLDDESMD